MSEKTDSYHEMSNNNNTSLLSANKLARSANFEKSSGGVVGASQLLEKGKSIKRRRLSVVQDKNSVTTNLKGQEKIVQLRKHYIDSVKQFYGKGSSPNS